MYKLYNKNKMCNWVPKPPQIFSKNDRMETNETI